MKIEIPPKKHGYCDCGNPAAVVGVRPNGKKRLLKDSVGCPICERCAGIDANDYLSGGRGSGGVGWEREPVFNTWKYAEIAFDKRGFTNGKLVPRRHYD